MPRHPFRLLFVLALAIAGTVVASVPGGAATGPGPWTVSSSVRPIVEGWQSLACPSATDCFGLAYAGTGVTVLEHSDDGGTSFVATNVAQAAAMSKVACATTRFCVMAGSWEGEGPLATTYVSSDGGSTWAAVALPSDLRRAYDTALGCSPSVCYLAVDGSLLSIGLAAHAWRTVSLPSTPDAASNVEDVACGGGRCVAVGAASSASTGLLFESDGGAWTETTAPGGLANPITSIFTVGCSAYACAAFGADQSGVDGALLESTAAGTWTAVAAPALLQARVISCVATGCLAAGGNWSTGGLSAWTLTGATPTWAQVATPTGEGGQVFTAAACAGPSRCLAGANRLFFRSLPSGTTWTNVKVTDGAAAYDDLSCSSASDCVASLTLGDGRIGVRVTTDGGTRWGPEVTVTPFSGFSYDLSCAGTACLLVGFNALTDLGWFARSPDEGRHWHVMVDPMLGGHAAFFTQVSCLSATTCVAVDGTQFGMLARTTDGGRSWTETDLAASSNKFGVRLRCMGASRCLAIVSQGTSSIPYTTSDGGAAWSKRATLPVRLGADSFSCGARGLCWLAGIVASSGRLVVLRSSDAGARWTSAAAPVAGLGTSVATVSLACWSSVGCALNVGTFSRSRAFVTTDAAARWSVVAQPADAIEVTASCPSATSCVGIGALLTGQSVTLEEQHG